MFRERPCFFPQHARWVCFPCACRVGVVILIFHHSRCGVRSVSPKSDQLSDQTKCEKQQRMVTTTTCKERVADLSPSALGSGPNSCCRWRTTYVPASKWMMRKNIPAIVRAGRAAGLMYAIMMIPFESCCFIHDRNLAWWVPSREGLCFLPQHRPQP